MSVKIVDFCKAFETYSKAAFYACVQARETSMPDRAYIWRVVLFRSVQGPRLRGDGGHMSPPTFGQGGIQYLLAPSTFRDKK